VPIFPFRIFDPSLLIPGNRNYQIPRGVITLREIVVTKRVLALKFIFLIPLLKNTQGGIKVWGTSTGSAGSSFSPVSVL
jgi:hypothetical protein